MVEMVELVEVVELVELGTHYLCHFKVSFDQVFVFRCKRYSCLVLDSTR